MQFAVPRRGVPSAARLRGWALAAATGLRQVTVRVVGSAEARRLNRSYRGLNRPTNVLSFAYGRGDGDIVLCHPLIAREARAQRKTLAAHYAHLVVQGMRHLRGHAQGARLPALRMEQAEIRALRRFGFGNPYELE